MREGLETASRDAGTLKLEYLRDRARGVKTALPVNYLPNDLSKSPPPVWRRAAERLFANWLTILMQCAQRAGDRSAA
jgi:homoserine O-succinyltransferase